MVVDEPDEGQSDIQEIITHGAQLALSYDVSIMTFAEASRLKPEAFLALLLPKMETSALQAQEEMASQAVITTLTEGKDASHAIESLQFIKKKLEEVSSM